MSRTKQLEPLKTLIATISSDFSGTTQQFKVYYGNVCEPLVNGQMLHLKEEDYIELLTKFLKEDGTDYCIPARSEVESVSLDVARKYKEGDFESIFKNSKALAQKKENKKEESKINLDLKRQKEELENRLTKEKEKVERLTKQIKESKDNKNYELECRIKEIESSFKKSNRINILLIILFGISSLFVFYLSSSKTNAYLKENDNVELHAVVHRKEGDEFVLIGTFKVDDGKIVPNE